MDLATLTAAWTPTPTDVARGYSDLVVFESQVLRNVSINYDAPTPLECHQAKLTLELRKHLSIRLQTLLRQGQGKNSGCTQ